MEKRIKYVENGCPYTLELLDKKVLYILYAVESGKVKPIIKGNDRYILQRDIDKLDLASNILGTNSAFGSKEFSWFFVRDGFNNINIEFGYMNINGELTDKLIDNLIDLMVKMDIKRIVTKVRKTIPTKNTSHIAITPVKDVKQFVRTDDGFTEIEVKNVYQFFNKSGKHFVNGPFQKCKQCGNWFRFSEEEIIFMKEHGIDGTHTCKRCKGRRVK